MDLQKRILVSTRQLSSLLGECSDKAAIEIATRAKAYIEIGGKDYWVISKIEDYLRSIAK